MQQLKIEHKKTTTNNSKQKVVSKGQNQIEVVENKREGHGLNIALTRRVYRLLNSDVYYVQSERSNDIYYYVKYIFDSFSWCSCPDNSIRGQFCKHLYSIEFAIMKGTLRDIEHLPKEAKRYPVTEESPKSYRDEEYDF
jgi:hypothetical protein